MAGFRLLDGGGSAHAQLRCGHEEHHVVAGAAERLTPEGILVVEIGNEAEYAEAAFGHLGLTWLTTSAGDEAVFLLTAEQLQNA